MVHIPFLSTVGGMQESPFRAADFYQDMMNFGTTLSDDSTNGNNGYNDNDITKIVAGHSLNPNLQVPEWLTDYRTQLNTFTENESNCDENYTSSSSTGKKGLAQFVSSQQSLVHGKKDAKEDANANVNVNANTEETKNTVDLMCLGPLTNVASWLEQQTQDDDIYSFIETQVKTIWIMGGNLPAYDLGGSGGGAAEAEFNFAQDPKAAYAVLNGAPSSITDKIIIVPADTCRKQVPDEFMWHDFCTRAENNRSSNKSSSKATNTMGKGTTESFSNGSLMDLWKNMMPSTSTSMDENPNVNVNENANVNTNAVENDNSNDNADLNQNGVKSASSSGDSDQHHNDDTQLQSRRRRQYYIDLIAKVIENDDSFEGLKFDPLCAFAYANPECIKIETMTARVDAQSGLLLRGNVNGNGTGLNHKQMQGTSSSSSSSKIWKKSSKKNQSSGEEESGADAGPASLRFVTDIQIDGPDGFIAWLNDALELDVDIDGSCSA